VAIVGVVPAAGYALRLQPLPHSKELLDVGGRPIMDYLIERMRAAGADELRVVTRPEKQDVIDHAERLGAAVVLGNPPTINDSLAAGLAGLAPDDIVLLGFPDSLWEPVDGFRRLVDVVQTGPEVALGLFDAPGIEGSDYLVLDESGAIADIDIKPVTPRSTWIWGCAAARARALEGLAEVEWPSTHMLALRSRGVEVAGVRLSSTYLDIGTHSSLERLPALLDARA
jgi:glucose-1-phosphate thymidylyltransferase